MWAGRTGHFSVWAGQPDVFFPCGRDNRTFFFTVWAGRTGPFSRVGEADRTFTTYGRGGPDVFPVLAGKPDVFPAWAAWRTGHFSRVGG